MKKQYIKSFLTVVTILIMVSACKKEVIMMDSSKYVVGFSSTETVVRENLDGPATIEFYVGAASGTEATEVIFAVDTVGLGASAAKINVDFTLSTTSVSAGPGVSTLSVTPVDNTVFTGNKKFYLVITSNSKNYKLSAQKRLLVTINDDEHPLKQWIGTYSVAAASYGSPGDWDELWTVTAAAVDGDVTKLTLTGVGGSTESIEATFNTVDMTISIAPGQSLGDPYGAGPVSVFKGTTDLEFIEDVPLVGSLLTNGDMHIDLWGHEIMEGDYAGAWDVFNTTWTKQ